jgi:hypothetical protein
MEFVSAEYIESPDFVKGGFKICYTGESGIFEVALLGDNLDLFRQEIRVRELRNRDEFALVLERHTFNLNGLQLVISGAVVQQMKSFMNV